MENNQTSRHLKFHYGLRTLFMLITLVCIYLGYSMNWIRQRREFLQNCVGVGVEVSPSSAAADPQAPWSLRLLGERGIASMTFGVYQWDPPHLHIADKPDIVAVSRLFPEASVYSLDPAFWEVEFQQFTSYGKINSIHYYQNGKLVKP